MLRIATEKMMQVNKIAKIENPDEGVRHFEVKKIFFSCIFLKFNVLRIVWAKLDIKTG